MKNLDMDSLDSPFKKGGKGLKMQIISLEVAGQAVQPVASCESDDSGLRQAGLGMPAE